MRKHSHLLHSHLLMGLVIPLALSRTALSEDFGSGNIIITKKWADSNDQDHIRPGYISFTLFADGRPINSKEAFAGSGWVCAFTGMPLEDNYGNLVEYSISENAVRGYESEIEIEKKGDSIAFSSVGKHLPLTTGFDVNVSWNDGKDHDGLRPGSLEAQLLADGVACGEPVTLSAEGKWQHHYRDLPVRNAGKEISYSLGSISLNGYEVSIKGSAESGFHITCKHNCSEMVGDDLSEMQSIRGMVRWDDQRDQDGIRPVSVDIVLFAEGKQIAKKTACKDEGWLYSFDNLPTYSNGKEIRYSINASTTEGYEISVRESEVVLSHTPGEITISGK